MVHKADVRFIDAEPEGLGGDHDFVVATHELILHLATVLGRHLAVIMANRNTAIGEEPVELVRAANAGGIDDSGSLLDQW